jgi:ubiquinone/menaquinone biosynthesis C-methylase UbiE
MDESQRYFQRVAEQWDALRQGYFTERVREAALAKADLMSEMVVVDVGSGTGFMAAGLAPLVAKVYAIDASPQMLAVARRNLGRFGNVCFGLAWGEALPLADASADAAFANMYLHHCADPLAAIREMARLLRPGGRLVITDMDRHDHEWLRQEMADRWLGFERAQVKAWFEQAGLVDVAVDCTGQECCAAPRAGGERANISVFVASGTKPARLSYLAPGTSVLESN